SPLLTVPVGTTPVSFVPDRRVPRTPTKTSPRSSFTPFPRQSSTVSYAPLSSRQRTSTTSPSFGEELLSTSALDVRSKDSGRRMHDEITFICESDGTTVDCRALMAVPPICTVERPGHALRRYRSCLVEGKTQIARRRRLIFCGSATGHGARPVARAGRSIPARCRRGKFPSSCSRWHKGLRAAGPSGRRFDLFRNRQLCR